MSDTSVSLMRASPPAVAALPREVLTWLQALGLGNAVKNPKRDLANGYVIAQICAHYWSQVPLHSFATGVSTASKQSNWYVLRKVMRKHEVDVSPAMVTGMVNGSDDCAVVFLKQLYTIFTGKTMEETPVPLSEPLTVVPAKDVPALVPSTANSAAVARARQAVENGAAVNGLAAASISSSRYTAMKAWDRGVGSRAASTSETCYIPNFSINASTSVRAAAAAPTTLPPIVPPPPTQTRLSAAAVTSGKPALNISVRPAGQVSTVVPAPLPGSAANTATTTTGTAADMPCGKEGEVWQHPPGTSLAAAWLCAKVRDAVPAEALEAFGTSSSSSSCAINSFTQLHSTLAWLSAADGAVVVETDVEYSREGKETGIHEDQAVLRQRAWQSLLSHVHEMADVITHCAFHGLDVVVDTLFALVARTVLCDDAGRDVPSGAFFVRYALQLCTALLAHLSESDVHLAVRCFQTYFIASDSFAEAVLNMKWCVAKDYARLVGTVLPPNRGAAAAVLESLWCSLEDVVRDAAVAAEMEDEADGRCQRGSSLSPSTQSAVSVLTLLRAFVETLMPFHSGTAVSLICTTLSRSPSPTGIAAAAAAVAGPSFSDGSRTSSVPTARPPSQRVRSAHAAAAAATTPAAMTEEDVFDLSVFRMAHQRCTAVLRQLHMSPASLKPADVVLAETAVALAIDLLRVELKTPTAAELVTDEAFFDVFHALFGADSERGDDDGAAPPSSSSWVMQCPTLAVLRARWLRWCLQRQWQLGWLGHSRPVSTAVAAAAAGDESTAGPAKEGKWNSDELRAVRYGLRVVCAELFAAGATAAAAATDSGADTQVKRCQTAKVLVACAMAETLPYLPAQFEAVDPADTTDDDVARDSITGGEEGAPRTAKRLSMHGDDGGDDSNNNNNSSSSHQRLLVQGGRVYAEAVAEACLHAFMREATSVQIQVLLTAAPRASGASKTNERQPQHPPQQQSEAGAKAAEDGEEAVTLLHPYVGPLAPYGPLVLRSDALLLVKAMLCVLDCMGAAAAGPAAAVAERDVAAVARHLGARAAVVAREGQVEERLALRIAWVHALLVEGRQRAALASAPSTAMTAPAYSSAGAAAEVGPPPLLASPVTEETSSRRSHAAYCNEATVLQWHNVILECWDTLMLVLQAATLRLRQRGGAAAVAATGPVDPALLREALGEKLLTCAQQAQEVVCCLEHELASVLPGQFSLAAASSAEMNGSASGHADSVTLNSALLSGPIASFVVGMTAEALQAAVGWMWTVVGGT